MKRKILFVCNTVEWFDRLNGNTYHSVRITRTKDNKTITAPWTYGYGEQYQTSALELMLDNKWINKKYKGNLNSFSRENNYPIMWNVTSGLKRDMIANCTL